MRFQDDVVTQKPPKRECSLIGFIEQNKNIPWGYRISCILLTFSVKKPTKVMICIHYGTGLRICIAVTPLIVSNITNATNNTKTTAPDAYASVEVLSNVA